MANILEDIQKKLDAGFDALDNDGKYVKLSAVKKEAFKAYNKEVASGNIDPIEYDFKKYFEWFTNANFTALEIVYDGIIDLIDSKEEESAENIPHETMPEATQENNENNEVTDN